MMYRYIVYLIAVTFFSLNYFVWKNQEDVVFWGIMAILILVDTKINELKRSK